jgi:hypothetical protein
MIDNAAQECLVDRPAYLEMYQAARSVLKPLSLERHKLAHGTWAYSNDERLKDGLIWIDAKITVKTAAKRVLALRDMRSMLDKADSGELHFDAMLDSDRVPWEHLWFYSRGDLERLRRDMTTALDLAERLVEVVDPQSRLMPGPRHRPKMTAAEWQYHQLLSAPAIQEALRRLRRKQQKIPEELLWLPYGADPEDP